MLPEGQEIVVYKNNSDGKGNSYGCHENYLMDRARAVRSHRHPRDARTSSRGRSSPAPARWAARRRGRHRRGAVPAHAAGRLLRGGGRARDDAQAPDRQHPRRAALRRHQVPAPARHRRRRQPVRGLDLPEGRHHRHRAGHDRRRRAAARVHLQRAGLGDAPGVLRPRPARSRSSWPTAPRVTALEVQWELLDRARKYADSVGLEPAWARPSAPRSSAGGRRVLTALEVDPMSLADQLDWVAKYRLIDGYRERHGLALGRRPPGRPRPAVPRPAARQVAVRPAGRRAHHHRRRGGAGGHRAAARHPGLLPGQVPAALGRRHRGRQLGLAGLRHRPRTRCVGCR